MKLNEKIYYYRKQAKLSQEELAAQVGVSRQAVSKWELGEATPEVDKLLALARAFGVSTDELLSESGPEPREPASGEAEAPAPPAPDQLDRAAGLLGRLLRRYGWLAGVYIALGGLGLTVLGALSRYIFSRMFTVTAGDVFGAFGSWVPSGQISDMAVGLSRTGEIFVTLSTVILVIGLCVMAAGAVLAAVLYRKGRKNS